MWTRNFKNLISTLVTCLNYGYNGTSINPWGDGYLFNFKDTQGVVREICTYNSFTDYASRITRLPFLSRARKDANSFSANVMLTTTEDSGTHYGTGKISIGLGSSNQEVSEFDYKLISFISSVQANELTTTRSLNSDGTVTITYKLIFTASSDITVCEIGLYTNGFYYDVSTTATPKLMLINRMLLDVPVSVASGETAVLEFSVTTPKISIVE